VSARTTARLLAMVLLPIIGRSSVCAAPIRVAVLGFRTYAPASLDCAWVGSGIADGVSSRLASNGTELVQVERAEVAQVLRLRSLSLVREDGEDAERLAKVLDAVRTQPVIIPSQMDDGLSSTCSLVLRGRNSMLSIGVIGDLARTWGEGGFSARTVPHPTSNGPISQLGREAPGPRRVQPVPVLYDRDSCDDRAHLPLPGEPGETCDQASDVHMPAAVLLPVLGDTLPYRDAQPPTLLGATHLVVGSVRVHEGLGLAARVTATGRVVNVATSAIVPGSGFTQSAPATEAGFQELEAQVARAVCQALGGVTAAVDSSANDERSALYRDVAEAKRLLYEGHFEQALATIRQVSNPVVPTLVNDIGALEASAYQGLIRQAMRDIDQATDETIKQRAREQTQQWCDTYEKAMRERVDTNRVPYAADVYRKAEALRFNHKYAEAIAEYREAIRLGKEDADSYFGLAYCLDEQNDFAGAIDAYTSSLGYRPSSAVAYGNRGYAAFKHGDYEQAMADYTRSLQLDPRSVWVYYRRGESYHSKCGYELAIADYTQALTLDPSYVWAYIRRGRSYQIMGKPDLAIRDQDKAIELNASNAWAYLYRGLAHSAKGGRSLAIADYSHAIERLPESEPDRGWCYNNRGYEFYLLGDY